MSTQRHAEVNIFTLALDLLYVQRDPRDEVRCSCIFFQFRVDYDLSVLRNPKHTVKFWFIENFLSPSFSVRLSFPVSGEALPNDVAQEKVPYGLVTYKWPTWLRQQREKQRIIWAYKILFLDVLFSMDFDKVILST